MRFFFFFCSRLPAMRKSTLFRVRSYTKTFIRRISDAITSQSDISLLPINLRHDHHRPKYSISTLSCKFFRHIFTYSLRICLKNHTMKKIHRLYVRHKARDEERVYVWCATCVAYDTVFDECIQPTGNVGQQKSFIVRDDNRLCFLFKPV